MNKILENVETIRKAKGFKQVFMAERLGVQQQTYSGYFNETGDMMISKLQEISDIFEMPLIDIITYPVHYIPDLPQEPTCEECIKKQETIDNLNELLRSYKAKLKEKQK